jgi:integrase
MHGTICPHPHMTLRRYLRKIRSRSGLNPWHQDVLRHVFASAALASDWRDIGNLCLELGHSSQKMLHRHYVRSMKRKDAVAIFEVIPMRMNQQ